MGIKRCYTCGGEGFVDKICPECGKSPMGSFNLELNEKTTEFVQAVNIFGVPSKYTGVYWSEEVLRKHNDRYANNPMFDKYCRQLNKIHLVFANHQIPAKSVIITAPIGMSKTTFVYSCIQHALIAGFKVAPVLDTIDVKRLLVLGADKPTYKLFNKVDYDSYLTSEVCFLYVTKLPQHEYAYPVINEVVTKRARFGLSTIVISDFQMDEITRKDTSNQFEVLDGVYSEDWYKFPAIVKFNPKVCNVLEGGSPV